MDRSRANLEEYERVLRLAAARQREAAGGDYSVGAPPLSRVSADVLLNLEHSCLLPSSVTNLGKN